MPKDNSLTCRRLNLHWITVSREDWWNIFKIHSGMFSTGLQRYGLLGHGVFGQITEANNCHLEPSISKLMREEKDLQEYYGVWQDSEEDWGWVKINSEGPLEKCSDTRLYGQITLLNMKLLLSWNMWHAIINNAISYQLSLTRLYVSFCKWENWN